MRYITASKIFSGIDYLKEHSVLVLNDQAVITDIISEEDIDPLKIEHFDGIITPGFINTHCHLELSHLKNKIARNTGIVDFGLNIIKNRNSIPEEEQIEFMFEADKQMIMEGIVAVGDISNNALSIKAKQHSSLHYHTFVELIALNPQRAEMVFSDGKKILQQFLENELSASLAPHAPYTVSSDLIKMITDACEITNSPCSIHNQESKTENDFFENKKGDYIRLYQTLNIPIDYFQASGKSSLQTVIPAINNKVKALLVHNTFTSATDIAVTQNLHQKIYWCLCPNANLYIEKTLPDIDLLKESHCKLTLGTDSLASNSSLSIIGEINTILKHKPKTDLETLLKASTYNGAEFLGVSDKLGKIEKNKCPGVNLIEGEPGNFLIRKLG